MADPDLELRGGGGGGGGGCFHLLALLAILPSVISSFLAQDKRGGGPGPPVSSPRSATADSYTLKSYFTFSLKHEQKIQPALRSQQRTKSK